MSNRHKINGSLGVRSPLMRALDVEYAHASRGRNLARMAEIRELTRLLDAQCPHCGRDLVPDASGDVPDAPEMAPIPLATQPQPELRPAFYGAPAQPQATNLRLANLQDILTRAEDGPPVQIPAMPPPKQPLMPAPLPPGGKGWRQQAKAAVLDAVSKANTRLAEGRGLYEQALMARNGKVEPLAGLKIAASIQGVTTEVLIEQLIAEYDAMGRRTSYVHAIQLRAIKDIDQAAGGDEADAIARQAIKDIMGENE